MKMSTRSFQAVTLATIAVLASAAGCGGTSEATVATNAANSHFSVNNAQCSAWGQANVAGAPADTFKCTVTLKSWVKVETAQGCATPLCAPAHQSRTLYIAVRDGKAYRVTV